MFRAGRSGLYECSPELFVFRSRHPPSFLASFDVYRIRDVSSKFSRGLRGWSLPGSPYPRLQRRLTFHLPSGKNAAFSLSPLKPDIGPQSNPKARAARMKYPACSELLRKAFSSIRGLFPTK